jgi:nucleotide-binding universal stress UspA family protein
MTDEYRRFSAVYDFREARQKAAISQILALLTGKRRDLLSYDTVLQQLGPLGSAERGLREIPLEAIAGSVGRTNDFTRDFLPRHDTDEDRWARVKTAATDPQRAGLPPIQVYQIGDAYFVVDGHHRVSVARQMGITHIHAYVTEVRTKAPLSAIASPEEVIARSEYVGFLEETQLDQARPGADLSVTTPGEINRLLQQIRAYQAEMEQRAQASVTLPAAAADWYETRYLPVVQLVREQGLGRYFPGRSEADLYLLVSAHRDALERQSGWEIAPEVGAQNLAARHNSQQQASVTRAGRRLLQAVVPRELRPGPEAGQWRREKAASRYGDRLFADILVPVNGEAAGWTALDQALLFAQREGARLHGLHVVPRRSRLRSPDTMAVRDQFNERCRAAGVPGRLALEIGEVAAKICQRAALNDLVLLKLAYPPAPQPLAKLGSGFRTIIRQCPRPVLAVPDSATQVQRVLLAYDGSDKAEEALFVAAYFGEAWRLPLVVVIVENEGGVSDAQVAHARDYLEMHELQATFVVQSGGEVGAAILDAAQAQACDVIVMGGYGANPVVEVMLGSTLDQVLRQARRPVLICH